MDAETSSEVNDKIMQKDDSTTCIYLDDVYKKSTRLNIPHNITAPIPSLGLFDVIPKELVDKIVYKISPSMEAEVVLRGVCKYFHNMFSKSHIEYKFRKIKRDSIIKYWNNEHNMHGKRRTFQCKLFYDAFKKYTQDPRYDNLLSREDHQDDFWWMCANHFVENLPVQRSYLRDDRIAAFCTIAESKRDLWNPDVLGISLFTYVFVEAKARFTPGSPSTTEHFMNKLELLYKHAKSDCWKHRYSSFQFIFHIALMTWALARPTEPKSLEIIVGPGNVVNYRVSDKPIGNIFNHRMPKDFVLQHSELEIQTFEDIAKSISCDILKLLLNGTFDKQPINRSECIEQLSWLVLIFQFPINKSKKIMNVMRRMRHLEQQDACYEVRTKASSYIDKAIEYMATRSEYHRENADEIMLMRHTEKQGDNREARLKARKFINRMIHSHSSSHW